MKYFHPQRSWIHFLKFNEWLKEEKSDAADVERLRKKGIIGPSNCVAKGKKTIKEVEEAPTEKQSPQAGVSREVKTVKGMKKGMKKK